MPSPLQRSKTRSATYRDVEPELAGQRLDNFLLAQLKGVPRSHVYRLIRSGQVRINSGRVRPSYRLQPGDRVRIPPIASASARPTRIPEKGIDWLEERILFEDDRLIVLDKPAGMAVHAGTGVDFGAIEALRSLRPASPALDLVHRLDRGTSGCLLVAKRRGTLRALHELIRSGRVEKRYLALVVGSWQHGRCEVREPLVVTRQRDGETFVRVGQGGKPALSRFRVVETYGKRATLLEVTIATGRMHQIRVHAAFMGHPLAGDDRYGSRDANSELECAGLRRIFLHAHALGFTWPDSGEEFMVSAPLPGELRSVQRSLEASGSKPRSRSV
ncbi:MAG TPA: RluA family pseudouridine synthase [Gammaproteobacteria bacterium]